MDSSERLWSYRSQSRSDRPASTSSFTPGTLSRTNSQSSLRSSGAGSSISMISGASSRQRGGAMSSQTRRILQELERISSPVTRRPWNCGMGDEDRTRRSRTDSVASTSGSVSSSPGRIRGPPLSSFHTPTRAEILPRLSRLTASSPHPYLPARRGDQERNAFGIGGKVKGASSSGRSTYGISDGVNHGDEDSSEDVVLPSIPLPISVEGLPKAGFLSTASDSLKRRQNPAGEEERVPEFSFSKPRSVDGLSFGSSSLARSGFFGGVAEEVEESGSRASTSSEESFVSTEMESKDSSTEKPEDPYIDTTSSSIFESGGEGMDGKWKCPDCHFNNQGSDAKCSQCLRERREKWTCQKCTAEYSKDVGECTRCPDFHPQKAVTNTGGETWTCNECSVPNEERVNSCVRCSASKPVSGMEWKCGKCLLPNKATIKTCICCGADKNYTNLSGAKEKSEKNGLWTCDTCLVPNKEEAALCICCSTPKLTPPSVVPGVSTWTCGSCSTKNECGAEECASCGKSKTSAPPESGAVNGKPAFPHVSHSSTSGTEWNCTACFVKNPVKRLTCHSCGTAKPVSSFSPVKFGFGKTAENKLQLPSQKETPKSSPFLVSDRGTAEKKSVRFADLVGQSKETLPSPGLQGAESTKTPGFFSPPQITSSSKDSDGGAGKLLFGSGTTPSWSLTSGTFGTSTLPTTSPSVSATMAFGVNSGGAVTGSNTVTTTTTTPTPVSLQSGSGGITGPAVSAAVFPPLTTTTATLLPMFGSVPATCGGSSLPPSFGKDSVFPSKLGAPAVTTTTSSVPVLSFGMGSGQGVSVAAPSLFNPPSFNSFGKKDDGSTPVNPTTGTPGNMFSLFTAKPPAKKEEAQSSGSSDLFKVASAAKRSAGSDTDEPSAKKTAPASVGFGTGWMQKTPAFGTGGKNNLLGGGSGVPALSRDPTQILGPGDAGGGKSQVSATFNFGAAKNVDLGKASFAFGGTSVSNGPATFGAVGKKSEAPALPTFGAPLFGNSGAGSNSVSGGGMGDGKKNGFQFGVPTTGAEPSPSLPPVFSFGQDTSSKSVAPDSTGTTFQFGSVAPGKSGDNPFSVGGGTVTGSVVPRQTLKARRKIARRP